MTVHVLPIEDWIEHTEDTACLCEPEVQFVDPETGEEYSEMLVIHNAIDGRE